MKTFIVNLTILISIISVTKSLSQQNNPPAYVTYVYKLDGKVVREGTFNPADSTLFIVISPDKTGDNKGIMTISAFTTRTGYLRFGRDNNLPFETGLLIEEHLSNYAEISGAIREYEKTGRVPQYYIDYEKNYLSRLSLPGKDRALTMLWREDCPMEGTTLPIYTTMPVLPGSYNDNGSRFQHLSLAAVNIIYTRTWYRTRIATFACQNDALQCSGWTNICFSGPLAFLNDRASSWISL
jgi:hypothetical protein